MAPAKKGMSTETKVEIGVGAAALAAAAAGAGYYFYGDKNAKKHRAAATKWAKGMKADVIAEAKKVKKFDQKVMGQIVDSVSAAYTSVRSVDKKDLTAAARELKKNWKAVQAEISGMTKSAAPAKKTVKKVAKKAAPKKAAPKKSSKKA